MSEEPPKSFLGFCNVRSWTLAVAIMNIVLITIILIGEIVMLFKSLEWSIVEIIIDIMFLYININLRNGVLKHDIAPIRRWLWVNLVLFIILAFLMFISFLVIKFVDSNNPEYQKIKENLLLLIIISIITKGITVLCYHPVYQYYKFEKANLKPTIVSGRQTV